MSRCFAGQPARPRDELHLDGSHLRFSWLPAGDLRPPCLPRSRAVSSAERRRFRPATVALSTLCGLREPWHFVRTLRMPAASRTARTVPPAMTPVPSPAGLSSTRPAPKCPSTSCGMVVADERDLEEVLLRLVAALADRLGDLVRLAEADADVAVAVADDDERREAEAAAALDDLGDAVDVDDLVRQLELVRVDGSSHCELAVSKFLELEPGLARSGGHRLRRGRGSRSRCGRTRPPRCPCAWRPSRDRLADLLRGGGLVVVLRPRP